jgi:hypothetical protein
MRTSTIGALRGASTCGVITIRLIQGTAADGGFSIVEALTSKHIAGPYQSFAVALAVARANVDGGAIWQQSVDHRGRLLGAPLKLPISRDGDGDGHKP